MLNVLHIYGSTRSDFYHKLSQFYIHSLEPPKGTNNSWLEIHPTEPTRLRMSEEAHPIELELCQLSEYVDHFDVAVSHMFCQKGMTTLRSFIEDILGLPIVGPSAFSNELATDKWITRAVAQQNNLCVPKGIITQSSEGINFPLPCIVKPSSEDNSIGVTLVREQGKLKPAIENALQYDTHAIVEEYIPGQEVRFGVIEYKDELLSLPAIEYLVNVDRPIRTQEDKVEIDDGEVKARVQKPTIPSVCPAELPDTIFADVEYAARVLHQAMHSRDYSLFDFRIHSETKKVYLIESCPFWTFTPVSVISRMVKAENMDLSDVALDIWTQASKRKLSAVNA